MVKVTFDYTYMLFCRSDSAVKINKWLYPTLIAGATVLRSHVKQSKGRLH